MSLMLTFCKNLKDLKHSIKTLPVLDIEIFRVFFSFCFVNFQLCFSPNKKKKKTKATIINFNDDDDQKTTTTTTSFSIINCHHYDDDGDHGQQ